MRTFRGRPGAGGLAPGRRLRFIGYSRSRHALAVLAGIALLLGVVAGGTVPAAAGTAAAPRVAGPVPRAMLAWGDNPFGQLGDGTTISRSVPVAVDLPAGVTVTAVAAGAGHSLALTSAGQLLAWGDNRHGQLGDGTTISSSVPVAVHLRAGVTVTAIAAGDDDSLALTSAGQLLAWGWNAYGQLGYGTTTSSSVPVAVDLPAGVTVTAVAAGEYYGLALTSAGQLLAWGDNAYGQLGDGTTISSSVPVAVDLPTATAATAIAAGYLHSLAIVQPLRIPPRAHPAVSIVKTASVGSFAVAGTPVTFTYTVTNTGNVPLYGVTVTDSRLGEVCGGPFTLAPGGTRPCTVDYVTSAADVAAGQIAGPVTVTGTAPGGQRAHGTATLTIPREDRPAVSIAKAASVGSFAVAGTAVTFTYTVTNTGNVPLHGVTVTDSRLGTVTCPAAALATAQAMTCTAAYRTTPADVSAGKTTSTAAVTADTSRGLAVTGRASITIPLRDQPAVSIATSASRSSFTAAGQPVTFTYQITDNGSVALQAVTVTDTEAGAVACPAVTLAAGQAMTCTAAYRTTAADVTARQAPDPVTAAATIPGGTRLTSQDSLIIPLLAAVLPEVPVTG